MVTFNIQILQNIALAHLSKLFMMITKKTFIKSVTVKELRRSVYNSAKFIIKNQLSC